jgi:hypothetical protein
LFLFKQVCFVCVPHTPFNRVDVVVSKASWIQMEVASLALKIAGARMAGVGYG